MKTVQVTRLSVLLCCLIACANRGNEESTSNSAFIDTTVVARTASDTFPSGRIIAKVFCKADANQSYSLYIPAKGNKGPLPVVYVFDPHGDGAFPLNKYKRLADA